jgi:hypothetical protein
VQVQHCAVLLPTIYAASSSNLIRSAFLKLSRFCNRAAPNFTFQPKHLQAHKETDLCADVVNTLSRGWPMCRYDMKPLSFGWGGGLCSLSFLLEQTIVFFSHLLLGCSIEIYLRFACQHDDHQRALPHLSPATGRNIISFSSNANLAPATVEAIEA